MGKYDGLEGKKFNKLTVMKRTENKRYYYDCICDCGNIISVSQYNLVSGITKSCKCSFTDRKKDLAGMKFGNLTAIRPCGKKNNRTVWLCKCDCGNEIEVVGTSLSSGNTKSCGCLTKKHGMFGTRIYNVWHAMKERCYVKSQISYPNYGGRGIKVCDEWQEFIPFMEWAYANGYDENAKRGECTLDRIDPNGNYCPENCRWVDLSVQANNKNTNVFVEYNGIVDTLSNHARKAGISPVLAEQRLLKGKNVVEIFASKKVKTIYYRGKHRTISDICKLTGISRSVIERRVINNGEKLNSVVSDIKSKPRKKGIRNRPVFQYDLNGSFLKKWENLSEIEKELGFKRNAVGNCCLGNHKTSNGYIWEYAKED